KEFHLGPDRKMNISVTLNPNLPGWALFIGGITLGEKARNKMKNYGQKRKEKEICLRAVCALLNSGGGMMEAVIKNVDYELNRDGIGHDLETSFYKMVPFVHKNLDFKQKQRHFHIFIKSWTPDIYGQCIVTLKTNLYIRNFSSSDNMKGHAALEFLTNMKESGGRLCSTLTDSPVEELASYFNKSKFTCKDKFPFTKSMHVELKFFSPKNIPECIKKILPPIVSAFANTEGGYLFLGIDGKEQQITGFKAKKNDLEKLESEISECIHQLPVYHFCEKKEEIIFSCKFVEVHDDAGSVCSYVCALRVERFCCAVFAKEPDSWQVNDSGVKAFTTEEWVTRLVNYKPVPSGMVTCIPEALCKELFLQHEGLQQLIQKEMDSADEGTLLFSKSWSLDLGLQENQEVICDVLLICPRKLPTLYSIVRVGEEGEGNLTALEEPGDKLQDYVKQITLTLKYTLVNLGGYTGKLGIVMKVLYLSHKATSPYDSSSKIYYPVSYYVTTEMRRSLLTALLKVL
uniref:Schlafen AlbA-2 domain-containing protein n=1 Tax=Jaculus jaculus TaxID=51337 RepID=A0A8C5LMK9_JACJA